MNDEARAELRAAWAIARKELRIALRYPLNAVNEVLQPLYQFLLPSLLLGATFLVGGRAIGLQASAGTDDLAGFLFLGMIVGGLVSTAFWEIAFSFKREMDAGTLEPAWLTPTSPETLVIGRAISGLLISGIASAVLLGLGIVVFGASVSPGIVLALPALLLAAFSMIGIGYLVASAVLLIREPTFLVDATNFLFAMASGVAFPVLVLPIFVRWVAYLLPTTYALDLLRAHAIGARPLLPLWMEWLALVGFALVMLWIGRLVFARTERRMRVQGTLGQH
jgi:ABC-type polysaccharide/polyol phosphate export permease